MMKPIARGLLAVTVVTAAWCQEGTVVRLAEHSFAAVGIAPGQTVRVTVLNTARRASIAAAVMLPCRVKVSFYDQSGMVLKEETLEDLAAGTAKWVDYSPQATILIYPPPRILVAAVVAVRTERISTGVPVGVGALGCVVIPTLEVFDASTSKTAVALAGPALTPLLPAARRVAPLERQVE